MSKNGDKARFFKTQGGLGMARKPKTRERKDSSLRAEILELTGSVRQLNKTIGHLLNALDPKRGEGLRALLTALHEIAVSGLRSS
jgi:hypothetical protein